MDQPIIHKLIFFFILITYLVDIEVIMLGEILSWSLMGVKGLKEIISKNILCQFKCMGILRVATCEYLMALLDGKEIYVCEKTKTEKAMRGFINVKFEVRFQLHTLLLP